MNEIFSLVTLKSAVRKGFYNDWYLICNNKCSPLFEQNSLYAKD